MLVAVGRIDRDRIEECLCDGECEEDQQEEYEGGPREGD